MGLSQKEFATMLGLKTYKIATGTGRTWNKQALSGCLITLSVIRQCLNPMRNLLERKPFLRGILKREFNGKMQAREDSIHQMGIKTFPRPEGIPDNFIIKVSKKGAGIKYIDPDNLHTSIRVMPGKSGNPFPSSKRTICNLEKTK